MTAKCASSLVLLLLTGAAAGAADWRNIRTVSYTHLTLPTN